MTAARRGDLAAIVTTSRDYVIGQPSVERTSVEIGVVTSVTRHGIVKAVHSAGWESVRTMRPSDQVMVVSAATIDVDAAMAMARAHVWPGHAQVKCFDSVHEAREALRPHLL